MFMVAARFCIALLGIILSLFLARSRIKITTGAIVGYFLLRVLGMAVLIFIFNIPAPWDLSWLMAFLSDGFRSGSFNQWYGSLFCFMIGGISCFVDSAFVLILLLSTFELLGVLLIRKALDGIIGRPRSDACLWLYMFNPIVLQGVWLSGQDEALQIFALGVLFWLMLAGRRLLLPVAGALMLHFTKPQSLWLVGAFLVTTRIREWVIFGLAAAGIVAIGMVTGLHVYDTANLGAQVIVPSGNINFFADKVFGLSLDGTMMLGLIGFLFLVEGVFCMGGPERGKPQGDGLATALAAVLFGLTFAFFSPFVFPSYFTYAIPFLVMILVRLELPTRTWVAYTLWSVAYSLDAVINYRIFDSVPKTNPLPLAGVFWAGGILVLHVWLFVEILLAAKTGNFSLVRGLRQFRL